MIENKRRTGRESGIRTQAFNKFNQLEEREWHIKPLKNNGNKQLRILLDP